MILDLDAFLKRERPYWDEFERDLSGIASGAVDLSEVERVRRFHYLFQRTSADLAKLQTNAAEPALCDYLENLVGRGYAELHETRGGDKKLRPFRWLTRTLPQTFRRHIRAFQLSLLLTLVGCLVGAALMRFDENARFIIFPGQFSHLHGDPSERVADEEKFEEGDRMRGQKGRFSASLMQNNIRVTINAMAMGIAWGIGTTVLLFYNGVILGAVCFDYIRAGETEFLLGWLLPHGSTEIPAILIGGQTGLMLGGAVLGWGTRQRLRTRLRLIAADIVTLIGGAALLLIWAGLVEAFFSQYHAPVLPYAVKIAFGVANLVLLIAFMTLVGRSAKTDDDEEKEEDLP